MDWQISTGRESIGCRACISRHRRDADPGGLSDAKSLLREIRETASPKLPNVFLIDITPDEVDGVKAFFQRQGGVTKQVDLLPVVQGRFVTLNGKTLDQLQDQHFPRRCLRAPS